MDHRIDISVNGGSGGTSGDGRAETPFDFLAGALERLNSNIVNLSSKIDTLNTSSNGRGGSGGNKKAPTPEEKHDAYMRQLGSQLASTISNAILTGVAVTGYRVLSNQATAIMGSATARGSFMAQAIGGNANGAFGNYASSLVDVERQRRISNTKAEYEGVWGSLGAITGGALHYLGAAVGGIAGFLGGGVASLGASSVLYGDGVAARAKNLIATK